MNDKKNKFNPERLKSRRLELDMTLENIGDIVGVGKSTVRKWECGMIENMKIDKLALLADAIKVHPLWLLGYDVTLEEMNNSLMNESEYKNYSMDISDLHEIQFAFHGKIKKLSSEDLDDIKFAINLYKQMRNRSNH